MNYLWQEIQHNPILWLLALVPIVFAAKLASPAAHTLLFLLAVLAIIPLATLLSHATSPLRQKPAMRSVASSMQRSAISPNSSLRWPPCALASSHW